MATIVIAKWHVKRFFLDFNDIDMLVVLIAALMLTFYQRYVGKSNGNLALISQSVDSKNHIYAAGVVILGAIFSTVGIHFVDPLIGVYIAVRILKDAIALSREAISSLKGKETDFSAYRIPFEKHYRGYKTKCFRLSRNSTGYRRPIIFNAAAGLISNHFLQTGSGPFAVI